MLYLVSMTTTFLYRKLEQETADYEYSCH